MSSIAPRELISYDFDVPGDFFAVPLDEPSDRWAGRLIDEVSALSDAPLTVGDLVEQLVELVRQLRAQGDPLLTAAVSLRPELYLTIGCLLTTSRVELEPGDTPDSFEAMLTDSLQKLAPGARTRAAETWQVDSEIGTTVGLLHRIEYRLLEADEGWIELRAMFGVFPTGCDEMINFTFTVSDLATFGDMRAETQQIVDTVRVTTAELTA
jgi:hypothetical protein